MTPQLHSYSPRPSPRRNHVNEDATCILNYTVFPSHVAVETRCLHCYVVFPSPSPAPTCE